MHAHQGHTSQKRHNTPSGPVFTGLCLTLALVLTLALAAAPAHAANTGGLADKPTPGDYTGSLDGVNTTTTGGNVTIDSDVASRVMGGYCLVTDGPADASHNAVTIRSGNIGHAVYGGMSSSTNGPATASHNAVTIRSGNIGNHIYGGMSFSTNGPAAALNNRVTMSGGEAGFIYGGHATSGTSSADASYNAVTFSGGEARGDVIGGYGHASFTRGNGSALATHNTVTVSGGTVQQNVKGGEADAGNSGSGNASAMHNAATVSGGTVQQSVFGGHATIGTAATSGHVTAMHNVVTISGGEVLLNVYGGAATTKGTGNASATHNTVTLLNAPVFGATSVLYGGYTEANGGTVEQRLGNTLNVFTSGITVQNILNFQYYNFALQGSGGASLSLTGTGTDVAAFQAGDVVRVTHALPGSALHAGQRVTLLSATTAMSGLTAPMLPNGQATQGISLIYDYTLTQSADSKSLSALVTNVDVNPQAKALTQGRTAALGFATMGGDLIAGAGMDNARGATGTGAGMGTGTGANSGLSGGSDSAYGLIPFFAVQASSMRYNTGSDASVAGTAFLAGLAKKWQTPGADIVAGAFFEASLGSYTTSNSAGGFSTVDGKGNTRSLGGGLLARVDMTSGALKGIYAEASARIGSLTSDYRSGDLRDFAGNTAEYDMFSTYYGVHAGLGYVWNFTDRASLDLYGKYFWTHQTGQNVTILGDEFEFKDADSHRIRLGGRLSYTVLDTLTPYIGAAWEHEFDGKARGTVYGLDLPSPNMQGSTGVGEVGLVWKPEKAQGFAVDLGVQGYTGMREGVSGTLQLRYEF